MDFNGPGKDSVVAGIAFAHFVQVVDFIAQIIGSCGNTGINKRHICLHDAIGGATDERQLEKRWHPGKAWRGAPEKAE